MALRAPKELDWLEVLKPLVLKREILTWHEDI